MAKKPAKKRQIHRKSVRPTLFLLRKKGPLQLRAKARSLMLFPKEKAHRASSKRERMPLLSLARKAETFSLPPAAEKFERPPRLLPPIEVPQPAAMETIRKKKTPSRAIAAVLAAGAMAVALLVIFLAIFHVDMVPALLLFLILFVGFGILIYNFLEATG